MRIASIDIGTNTILLLVAETSRGTFTPIFEQETVVRLGEGLQKSGLLSEPAMDRGIRTLGQYLSRCREMRVERIFTVGTSALREAANSADFIERSQNQLDLPIQVIPGEEEARLSYLAVAKDLKEADQAVWVIDVGGGSTELILGEGGAIHRWVSLPLGLVRFTERFLTSDPVRREEWETMKETIGMQFSDLPCSPLTSLMVSVGGTGTTLASVEQGLEEFVPDRIHNFALSKEAIGKQLDSYLSKTVEERRKIPGLPPNRADVILAGGTILYLAMEKLGCSRVRISSHGVRYGLLYDKLPLD